MRPLRQILHPFLLAVALLGSTTALAHPHAWIDLHVEWFFDADGQLEYMQQSWHIDPTYSHMLLEEMTHDLDGSTGIDAALEIMAERMLENLAAYDYFTVLVSDGKELNIPAARNARLTLEDRRLRLRFDLPLTVPANVPSQGLSYRVFDPEYWIEILHAPDDAVQIHQRPDCRVQIEAPRPDARLIRYAATLERQDRSPVDDLGRHFAETATLECD